MKIKNHSNHNQKNHSSDYMPTLQFKGKTFMPGVPEIAELFDEMVKRKEDDFLHAISCRLFALLP